MKNKVNPVAIGMFVLGALVLAVAAVMLFGAAKFFANDELFISYFSESVNGLDVGAPVKYKGVKIGKVERIMISYSKTTIKESSVSVIYSIDMDLLKRRTGVKIDFDNWIDEQINDGMRAKLNYQSIVTGMLYIELDYLAESNEKYTLRASGLHFKEIPSVKTGLAEIAKGFEKTIDGISKIDFASIGTDVHSLVKNMNNRVESLDVKALNASALKTLDSVNELVSDPNLKSSLANLDIMLKDADVFLKLAQNEFIELSDATKKTLATFDNLAQNLNTLIMPQSPLRYELALLVRTLNDSVSSISNLTDYLQRNPSSLLTGKAKQKGNN